MRRRGRWGARTSNLPGRRPESGRSAGRRSPPAGPSPTRPPGWRPAAPGRHRSAPSRRCGLPVRGSVCRSRPARWRSGRRRRGGRDRRSGGGGAVVVLVARGARGAGGGGGWWSWSAVWRRGRRGRGRARGRGRGGRGRGRSAAGRWGGRLEAEPRAPHDPLGPNRGGGVGGGHGSGDDGVGDDAAGAERPGGRGGRPLERAVGPGGAAGCTADRAPPGSSATPAPGHGPPAARRSTATRGRPVGVDGRDATGRSGRPAAAPASA